MWRSAAIRSLLLSEVAALREPASAEDGPATVAAQLAHLAKAQRRALWVMAFDWLAILALFLFHRADEPFLVLGATPRAVFTLAILAVAIHSGFRWGQLEKYRAVERAVRELAEREPEAESGLP